MIVDFGQHMIVIVCGLKCSRRQPFTPLGAAGLYDLTAAARCHASAKTVVTGSFEIARLKCSFHDDIRC